MRGPALTSVGPFLFHQPRKVANVASRTPLYLGLDVGTQGVRAALIDSEGVYAGFGIAALDTRHPRPGWAEQDPREWWQSTRGAVREALARSGATADRVQGIGLDCTACTVLACRADGTPLRPALLWMDHRAYREAEQISATADPVLRYVSGSVSPEWMLPKALWLKRHEPAIYAQADRLVECTDWMMFRLTGAWRLSLNNITVKWNYSRPEAGWSQSLLRAVDLEDLPARWPAQIVPLGQGDACLHPSAAEELGLLAGTPVAQGGIDAYLGMVGMGAVGAGDLAVVMGSSTCHLVLSERAVLGSGMLGCYPDAVIEGMFTLEGGQAATGSVVNWYRQHLAGTESREAERTGRNVFEILDERAAAVPPGGDGLVCLDYWQGSRSPIKDPRARGTLWGLTLAHGPGHIFRSIYEATAFGTRHILEDLQRHGVSVKRVVAGGGGARSRLWLEIHADVLGQPLYVPRETEACALGSAIAAAAHAGAFRTLGEAAHAMVGIGAVVEPDPRKRALYDFHYGKYIDTYSALRGLMHDMADSAPRWPPDSHD
jgi:FGGY-family pentulose kinase